MTTGADSRVGDGTPSVGELHAVLANETRRRVLRFFRDREVRVASRAELADYLVARDDGAADRRRTEIRLHHSALPKLSESGAIDYDPRTGTIRYYGGSRLEALLC